MRSLVRHSGGWLLVLAVAVLLGMGGGCGDEVNVMGGGATSQGGTGQGNSSSGGWGAGGSGATDPGCTVPAERVDLLLSVDNSRSMADKQQILALTVPDLIGGLVNPPCLEPNGMLAQNQPPSPTAACPDPGTVRAFPPVVDLHVGVVSSSLGDHGGDVCPSTSTSPTNDDMAHLLSRNDVGGTVSTYQGLGFLAWDPGQVLSPPGDTDPSALGVRLTEIVMGAGEVGCGYESQLESWYRFLIDPDPYLTIEEQNGMAEMSGTDTVVLDQRAAFLRPDSLVLILMLTDENDCSIRDGGQYFYAAKSQSGASTYHLPRAQITCQTDPADECCRSCGQSDDGCPPKGDECATAHDNLSDALNVRCFDQKRRFGIDFLNPIERYVTGLTASIVQDREGDLVPNPLYSDLDPDDSIYGPRSPAQVFVAGIVGVPWQLIARTDSHAEPDLVAGLDANDVPRGGYQTAAELAATGAWDRIVGDFADYGHADDPHMIESVDPRPGLPGPTAGYLADGISGHDRTIQARDDLQHACIFPLPEPRDCSAIPTPVACDCQDPANDNALCESPDGTNGTTQYFAKAYPSLRQLELLKQLDSQGIVGSICPPQLDDPSARTFAYRATALSILEAITRCL